MQKITICGRAGSDAQEKFLQSGAHVASFSVAVDSLKKGQKETTWYRVSCWSDLADRAAKIVQKGGLVVVHGTLRASIYQGKLSLEVIASEIVALSKDGLTAPDSDENAHEDVPF